MRHEVRVNLYRIVDEAVADAVAYGYRRAHKHTEHPSEDQVTAEIENAVMGCLCDIINFGDDDDE